MRGGWWRPGGEMWQGQERGRERGRGTGDACSAKRVRCR